MYNRDDNRPAGDQWRRTHRSEAELQRLIHAIATRVTRALGKQGLLLRDDQTPSLGLESVDELEQPHAAPLRGSLRLCS